MTFESISLKYSTWWNERHAYCTLLYGFLRIKEILQSLKLQAKLTTFSLDIMFTWKNNWLVNYDYLVLGIWKKLFWKPMKCICFFSWKHLKAFVVNSKIWVFRQIIIWKPCICYHEHDNLLWLKYFPDEMGGNINK